MNRETAEPTVDRSAEAAAAWVAAHRDVAAPSEHSHEFVWDVTGDAAGPFVTDLDGNVLVAFTCHIGAAPLGYNNPKILDKLREDRMSNFKSGSGNLDFGGSDFQHARIVATIPQYTNLYSTVRECISRAFSIGIASQTRK